MKMKNILSNIWLVLLLASYNRYVAASAQQSAGDVSSCQTECVQETSCDAGRKACVTWQEDDEPHAWTQQGRVYYNSLLDKACERDGLVSLALNMDFTDKAFNEHGSATTLAKLGTDGSDIRIRDIFLIARLSNDNKLHIHSPGNVPVNPQFGHAQSEQYLHLIAPTVVRLGLSQKAYNADITALYRFDMPFWCSASLSVGAQLPIKHKEATVDLSLDGGRLYQAGTVQQATQRETTVTQFFKDFVSIEDFLVRAVLRPKGLAYERTLRKTGIGDLSLFAILDIAECWEYVDGLQFGITIVTPTASKAKAKTLFELELGNGGGVLIDLFSNILFRTCTDYVNPTFQIGAEFGANRFKAIRRISQTKTQAAEGLLRDNPTLIVPVFREYRTDAFSELDSTVPLFADAATMVSMKHGHKFFVGFGNYFYDLFRTTSRLGIFYDYLRQSKDTIFDAPASFNTDLVTKFTASQAHRIGWNLSAKTSSGFEVAFGSQHVVAGKNVAKLNEAFVTLTAVF